jgi:hypothetical protein
MTEPLPRPTAGLVAVPQEDLPDEIDAILSGSPVEPREPGEGT